MRSSWSAVVLATVAWGLWGICDKLALRSLPPPQVQIVNVVVAVLGLPFYYALLRGSGRPFVWDPRGLGWAVGAAAATGVASIAFVYALARRDASQVVSLTAGYPVVTLLVAAVGLGEALTWSRVFGLALMLSGVWLVGR
jgi:transporter family protein